MWIAQDKEPGCITNGIYVDGKNPDRPVFVEQWADIDALQQHFRMPELGLFVHDLGKQRPQIHN